MIRVSPGFKLVYNGKELMLPGTVLTVKDLRTYMVDGVFETMALFDETGDSEYNIRFFCEGPMRYLGEFHGIHPDVDLSKIT
jgi:hypothetical protein